MNRGARAKVIEYLLKRVGEPVYIEEMLKDTGISNKSVLQNTVSNIKLSPPEGMSLETMATGRIWRLRSAPKSAPIGKRMFEELAVTKTGDVLIQDEEGKVYRAVEL